MKTINVEGLPDSIIHSLQQLVDQLRNHPSSRSRDELTSLERMKLSAGSWADIPDEEYEQWLKEVRQGRGHTADED